MNNGSIKILWGKYFENRNQKTKFMRFLISVTVFYSFCTFVSGQEIAKTEWYSETNTNGIVIQNSYPKGGPYPGTPKRHFNYSRLVFFTRIVNETKHPIELTIHFSADSIPIPGSPNTFVKLFLPSDTMTHDKQSLFNYGARELESFDESTRFQKTISPDDECLFYVVAIFYQTKATAQNQQRGGNRAEFVLIGQDLFYKMPPQINSLHCGQIISVR